MESKVSRRSLLLGAFGGMAALTAGPIPALAAQLRSAGTTSLPTAVWAGIDEQNATLETFWTATPDRLQPHDAFRLQGYLERPIVVSPDRLVQLSDGRMLSLVAWQQSGAWQYGLADLPRAKTEGWNEQALPAWRGLPPDQLVGKAAANLVGKPTQLSVLAQPAVPVRLP